MLRLVYRVFLRSGMPNLFVSLPNPPTSLSWIRHNIGGNQDEEPGPTSIVMARLEQVGTSSHLGPRGYSKGTSLPLGRSCPNFVPESKDILRPLPPNLEPIGRNPNYRAFDFFFQLGSPIERRTLQSRLENTPRKFDYDR